MGRRPRGARLWPAAAALALFAGTACFGSSTSTDDIPSPAPGTPADPVPFVIAAPAREATRVAYVAAALLMREAPGVPLRVEADEYRPEGSPADVVVSRAALQDPAATPVSYWLLAAHPLTAPREVASGALLDLYRHGRAGASLFVPDVASLDPFDGGPGTPRAARMVPPEDLAAHLWSDPSALALVPSGLFTDPRLVFVPVDGVDLLREPERASAYPLATRLRIEAHATSPGRRDLAASVAQALRKGLSARPPPPATRLIFTGDVIPARCAYARQAALGDFAHAFRALAPFLSAGDITVGSLDAAVSDAGTPIGCEPTFSLLAPAASVEGFRLAGYDVMTVATNHVKDCGASSCGDRAFLDTLANLRASGIAPVGGGRNLAEARAPVVIEANGVRFAFLGYDAIAPYYHAGEASAGTAPLREDILRADVTSARQAADVVVVLPQWGVEYTSVPVAEQRRLARAAIETGAALIVGNHPHWVQASEVVAHAFVAYALGNFVFDQSWSLETQQGAMLEAVFWGSSLRAVRYYPVRIVEDHRPVLAGPEEAAQILARIIEASEELAPP